MGEYATDTATGERVKIGTCEDLFYLRYDQLGAIHASDSSETDPRRCLDAVRFRFPWPDEDDYRPGDFADHARALTLSGVAVPKGVDHGRVQLSGHGYLCSIPCPEGAGELGMLTVGGTDHVYKVHRNGFAGAVRITGQAVRHGTLVTIAECGGCGTCYRLDTIHDAEPIVTAITKLADFEQLTGERNNTPGNIAIARRYVEIARRIVAGYMVSV